MKIYMKNNIFNIFAQNIDCGYMLEPPCRGGSNEYQRSMLWGKNKKNRYTHAYPILLYKTGFKRVYITRTCFLDVYVRAWVAKITCCHRTKG